MAVKFRLTKKQIIGGTYEGLLKASSAGQKTPTLEMIHLGNVVGNVTVTQINSDGQEWLVRADIPAEYLIDGVQTFLFVFTGRSDILDRFSIITGEPMEDDLRGEVDLLRAELDMLKRAFRRHCIETMP